ncbi:tryptophan--tRNA ligase [Paenibacillus sp. P22]|uniref:tryptophan--tRNA ligase n=1 Tax=Paenibacillus sp. P22 TaxID=483908 RepID=UPI000660A6B1|nr:tryptophan--tRNA ligase [Paenibacillus sp. P22]
MEKRILSGMKPSGELNIGGYGGALSQFVAMQEKADCYFFIPDLHAVTVWQDPRELRERSMEIAALYLAAGIDPKRSAVFFQSQVPAHAELGWLMETQTAVGELGRMTQYKEKADGRESVSSALFTYPAYMAADILLYQATHVPVGDDQKQHLELARNLAVRFNSRFKKNLFTIPEPIIAGIGSRIMGLDDPSKKMSKSNPNRSSSILLMDEPDDIRRKFAKAVTDSEGVVRCDWDRKPGISSLLEIYSVFSGMTIGDIESRYQGVGYGSFKEDLAEAVIAKLEPLQRSYREIAGSEELDRVLKDGALRAAEAAAATLKAVKEAMGFVV